MNTPIKFGFLLINKPKGISSYGCIVHIKQIVRQKIKIGHTGTLDPFASGLLIVAIGREATARISTIASLQKSYVAQGKLGVLTDTLDLTGSILQTIDHMVQQNDMEKAVASFGSSYEQIPPLYSALKHGGYPLYKLAREKRLSVPQLAHIAEQKKRLVHLYEFDLLSFAFPFFTIKASVSQGSYIRSLINDSAIRAGSCATTYALERTAIGHFSLSDAVQLHQLNTIEDINSRLILM
jgi:tRNA pseudouridine55 synthase